MLCVCIHVGVCIISNKIRSMTRFLEADQYAKSSWNSEFCDLDSGNILHVLLNNCLGL